LHYAACYENIEIITKLIRQGAKLDSLNSKSQTPLHIAALSGNSFGVNILLERGADTNSQDSSGQTPLHLYRLSIFDSNINEDYLSDTNSEDCLSTLCKKINNINARDFSGKTPLHCAAKRNDSTMIQILLENKASIDAQDKGGRRAIHYALEAADKTCGKAFQVLIEQGASVNDTDFNGNTCLHLIASLPCLSEGTINLINNLPPEKKANISLTNNKGESPLHIAVKNHDNEMIQHLLDNHVNKFVQNKLDQNILHYLFQSLDESPQHFYSKRTLQKLSPPPALFSGVDRFGNLPIHYFCKRATNFSILDKLITEKKNYAVANKSGWTPLHVACFHNNKNLAFEIVCDLPGLLNSQIPCSGKTALMIACENGFMELCQVLCKSKDLDLSLRDNCVGSALDWALEFDQIAIFKMLLNTGLNCFPGNGSKEEAQLYLLQSALEKSDDRFSGALFEILPWDSTDAQGNTVLHIACKKGCLTVAQEMLRILGKEKTGAAKKK
jgi:ankyrin repeat protein